MGWLKKKSDPISDRARALNAEIAALESQIKRLDARVQRGQESPRLRSTAVPHGTAVSAPTPVRSLEPPPAPVRAKRQEPVFEDVDQQRLTTRSEPATTPDHYNQLGVRKYDFPALIQRARNLFRGPSTTNPKLVSYLAAGGIQGLRPLRKEKRVARNRFIALVIFLFLLLLGIISVFVRNR